MAEKKDGFREATKHYLLGTISDSVSLLELGKIHLAVNKRLVEIVEAAKKRHEEIEKADPKRLKSVDKRGRDRERETGQNVPVINNEENSSAPPVVALDPIPEV